MKKKIATRPLSGFDELDAAGIGAGYRAFEEEQPVAEAPKEKSTSLGDYSNAAGSGVLKGIAGTATGIGTFAQAPAANTLSGVLGARALVDRGVTGVRNWINPGSSALDEDVQSNARMASQFAAEERAKNSADGGIAGAAKSVEGFGRASTQALKDFDENYNPELIKQEKNVSDAKGFWGTAKATLSNPLALTGSLAQSAPDMALGVGVGSLAARSRMALGLGAVEKAGAAAAKTVAASGGDLVAQGVAANAARDAAAQALQKSATHVAGSVGVVSESASSAYGGREGTYQQVMGMPEQTLLKTPRYNAILAATGDPAKARMQFANEIADQAPMLTALGTALGSMAITKITGHDLTAELAAGAKKTTAKDIAVNALGHEGPEEVLQGIPEDLVQHGAMVQADPDHELDLGGGIAQNYIAGAVMGAGGTGASYVKDKFGKQAPVDPAAAAAKLLADQQEAARKAAVGAAHAAAATPNSPISRAAAAANPMTPEEAWAKAQELDAQAALDEANGVTPVIQAPVDVGGSVGDGQGGVNEPAPIDNDPTIKDSLTTQPAFDVQAAQEQYRAETLAAQQAQDDELKAQAEAALAKMAQNKQKTRPVNEVVSDGGYLYEGTQDGDVLNGLGKPFSIKMGALQEAKRQARENGGNWTVAPVFDGYVARKKEASNVGVQDGTEPRSAEPDELAGDNANAGMGDRPVDRLPEGDNPLGADADPLGQSGEQAGGVDAAPVAQTLTEAKRRDYGDGYTGIEYSFGSGGTANVMVKPDGSAYLTDIVLGDSESDSRGKGQGTAAYIELGRQLAEQGVKLESTRWSKHKSAIAPSALRIWQKLEAAGLARQTGVEEGKVYDRFSSNEDEVKSIPVYEFIGNQSNNVQNTAPAANDPEAEAAPNPQHQEQFPPSQAGDILNLQGKPFNTMAGAMLKLKRLGDGHEIVRVDGGLVIRPKAAAPVAAPAQEATETVAPSEVERYQWQRNAEGGQERGNQQTIQPLTEALFNEYIAPKVAVKSYRDYQQQFPAATHISLVQKADGSVELGAGGVGPIEKLRPSAAPVEKGWVKAVDSFDSPEAVAHGSSADSAIQPKPLAGQPIDKDWTAFHPESGTLNVPRADMPQIKSENRGALVNFLKARGISSTQEEVPTESLKPTQREYSPEKVEKAKGFKGNDRSILVSSDGHVLDGHHQWVAKHEAGEPVKVIRLDAPIDALLSAVREFPSAETTVNSTTQEKANEKAPKTEQEPAKQQAATGAEPVNAAEPDQPAAEPAGASPSEVDLTTVEGVARAVQLKVATNRRKSREKSRKEREAKGYAPNSTPESEQADYEAEISAPPSDMQKQSAAAMLGADPLPLIRMFVNGNFEASEDVFKAITGVKIRGLSAAAKKAALYQWAGWTPEQIAQAEGDVQARKDEAAEKYRQDDLKSAVMGAWLGLDRLKVKEKDGTQTTGQDFVLKTVASGFDKAHSQKKGAAVIYGLTDGSRFTTLKAREFTAFVKSAIAFGGLDKALAYVSPPKPQAPEGFVDRSIDTANSRKADPAPVEPAPQAEPAAPTQPTEPEAPATTAPEADAQGGFDPVAFDKERDDRIKASREAGNVHLDKVPPYVESMRGKQIYYAHDPKITGTIRTVDNRGTVYVNWNDAYSAEKELASPTQDGKKTVMQSGLAASDLKDYVLGKPTAPAAEDGAKGSEPAPRPKNWENNYGAASKIAEAMGIALRGANGKMKKVPELVAEIKAADDGPKEAAEPKQDAEPTKQVDAAQAEWTRTRDVDRMAMMLKLGYSEEVARRTAGKSWDNVGGVFQVKLAKAMAEPLTPVAPTAPTGEDALYTSTAKLTQPYTLDDFIGNVDAGYRAHFDYAGADGRTLWIERVEGGWVLKSKDDDSTTTITKGGAGAGGRWNKAEAMRAAEDDAKYRYTEWKPFTPKAEGMFQTPAEKAAIENKPKEVTSETARKAEFALKDGNRAKVVENATRGVFTVSVANAKGENFESYGTFQMDDQFGISRVAGRANWAMDAVREASYSFVKQQKDAAESKAITQEDVNAAERQALGVIEAAIDQMKGESAQRFAAKFLPSMGVPVVMGKEKLKAAMADPKINLLAAASDLGIGIADSVRAALLAKFEGRIATADATPSQAMLNQLLNVDSRLLLNDLDAATHDVDIGFLKALHDKLRDLDIGASHDRKLRKQDRIGYVLQAIQAKETGKGGIGAKKASNFQSSSPAVQDFIDGKRDDAPTIEEVKAEKPGVVTLPKAVSEAIESDLSKQKRRVMRLKSESAKDGMTMAEKVSAQTKHSDAEKELRKMRLSIFDAEDAAVKALASGNPEDFAAHKELFPDAFAEISKLTAKPELSPLIKAMNFLMELQAKQDANGRIGDDRLETMIRQQKAVVKELQDAANKPADTPSQEPSNTIKSSPSEDAAIEAKTTIEQLDAQIKRHEELLGCLG